MTQTRSPMRDGADLADAMGIAFSDEQLDAITAPLTPNLIVAGAGTGKTTVMAARVVWLVSTGQVASSAVLGLTFTRRAAGELGQRLTNALGALGLTGDEDPLVLTYDAFVGQLLDSHGLRLGVAAPSRLMANAEPFQLAVQAVNDPGFTPVHLARLTPTAIVEKVVRLDRQMASHMVSEAQVLAATRSLTAACAAAAGDALNPPSAIEKVAAVAGERGELVAMVHRYRELKRHAGVAEFADLQGSATSLVHQSSQIGAELRDQFRVVLLDEYQDTSVAQAAMLSALFSGPNQAGGRGHPVSAVGDPSQAIYGWRGAAADNMGQFANLFPLADGGDPPCFALRINRRSGQLIVDAANAVASNLRSGTVTTAQPDLKADLSLAPGSIEANSYETWPDEVAGLSERIVEAHRLGQAKRWRDVAVLTRRNGDIPAIYQGFCQLGVPVEIVGLGGLLALPEIAAVVALLRLALDEADNPAAALLVSGPMCGLDAKDMAALAQRAAQLAGPGQGDQARADPPLVDAIFDPGSAVSARAAARLRQVANIILSVRRQRHESPVDLVGIAVDELGLSAELAVPSEWSNATAAQVRRFIEQVGDQAARVGPMTLSGLVAWLRTEELFGDQLDQATPSEDDSVKLLTVHKAKGLEWSVVALPCLARDIFPNDRVGGNPMANADALPYDLRLDGQSLPQLPAITSKALTRFGKALKDDQIQSEDRLAYVAVSRAKTLLIASTSAWRTGWTSPRPASRLYTTLAKLAQSSGGVVSTAPIVGQNPLAAQAGLVAWPITLPPETQEPLDKLVSAVLAPARSQVGGLGLSAEDDNQVAMWQAALTALREQATPQQPVLPVSLSASALMAAHHDHASYLASLARPMPQLANRAAANGVLFHRWVERRFALAASFDESDEQLAGGGVGLIDLAEIGDLVTAFEAGRYATRTPLGLEVPFVAVIAGQQVRGRIDAVYAAEPPWRYQIVDWKTSPQLTADPVQLAIYRLAWAQAMGCPPDEVDAVFYYVVKDLVVRPGPIAQSQIETWVNVLRQQ